MFGEFCQTAERADFLPCEIFKKIIVIRGCFGSNHKNKKLIMKGKNKMPYKKTIEKFDEIRNKESEQLIVTVGANQSEVVHDTTLSMRFEEMIKEAPISQVHELGGLLAVFKARGSFETKYLSDLKQKYDVKAESEKLKGILEEENKIAKVEIDKLNQTIETKYQKMMGVIYGEIDKHIKETEQERQDLAVISEQVNYLDKSTGSKIQPMHIGVNAYCNEWAENVKSPSEEDLVAKVINAVNKKYSTGGATYDIINKRSRQRTYGN